MSSVDLLRIEHKLDLILHSLKARDPVLAAVLADWAGGLSLYENDTCPVCEMPVHVTVSPSTSEYTRSCGCKPPFVVAQGLEELTKPPATSKHRVAHLQPEGEMSDAEGSTASEG